MAHVWNGQVLVVGEQILAGGVGSVPLKFSGPPKIHYICFAWDKHNTNE